MGVRLFQPSVCQEISRHTPYLTHLRPPAPLFDLYTRPLKSSDSPDRRGGAEITTPGFDTPPAEQGAEQEQPAPAGAEQEQEQAPPPPREQGAEQEQGAGRGRGAPCSRLPAQKRALERRVARAAY